MRFRNPRSFQTEISRLVSGLSKAGIRNAISPPCTGLARLMSARLEVKDIIFRSLKRPHVAFQSLFQERLFTQSRFHLAMAYFSNRMTIGFSRKPRR